MKKLLCLGLFFVGIAYGVEVPQPVTGTITTILGTNTNYIGRIITGGNNWGNVATITLAPYATNANLGTITPASTVQLESVEITTDGGARGIIYVGTTIVGYLRTVPSSPTHKVQFLTTRTVTAGQSVRVSITELSGVSQYITVIIQGHLGTY